MKLFKLSTKQLHKLAASSSIWAADAKRELARRKAASEAVQRHFAPRLTAEQIAREIAEDFAKPDMMTKR